MTAFPIRRAIVLATSACALAAGVSACGDDSGGGASSGAAGGGGGEEVKVGLITKTETNPFFVKMKEGANAAAESAGADVQSFAGKKDGDNESQVAAVESLISAGAKGLMITPSDSKAIVPSLDKARQAGLLVIALDTQTEPADAADITYATDNYAAGLAIGKWAKGTFEADGKQAKIAMLDLNPDGVSVDVQRDQGFLEGFGIDVKDKGKIGDEADPQIVGHDVTDGAEEGGRTAMENLLQKDPGIKPRVYTINEPAAAGAYEALKAAGKEKDVTIVSVDGGCPGVENVKQGVIGATSQQYPLKMAEMGVQAITAYAKDGTKPEAPAGQSFIDTGVTLITDKPVDGVESKDTAFGLENCWGYIGVSTQLQPAPQGAGTAGAVGTPRTETLSTRVHDLLHRNATLGPLFVLLLAVVYFSVTADRFLAPANLSLIVQQVMVVGTLGIAQTLVILTAGIDLSVGAIMVLSSMVMAKLSADAGLPGLLALLLGFGIGTLCGLANGALVTRLKLPPFIVTLGTLNVFFALNLYISKSETVRGTDMSSLLLWTGNTFNLGDTRITYGSILMLVLFAVFAWVLKNTAWGKHVYAVGDDAEAARLAGVRKDRVLLSVYIVAGLICAVAAWMLIGRIASASPQAGVSANLDSITAVVIGGTSLFGGRGRVIGTLFGALIVGVLRNGLTLTGVDVLWQDFAVGLLIIAAVAIDQWIRKVKA